MYSYYYEAKDKPSEMLSSETLWGDFAEMDKLMEQLEKDEAPEETEQAKVGAKNKESIDELKGVVHKIQLENANKGNLVKTLMKVVDEKSSNMEKVMIPSPLINSYQPLLIL